MKKINSQKGQALILIALAVVGLVGFTALTIDGGRVLSDRRNAQNAADTSVLAAALAKVRNQNYVTAATSRATSNGYTTSGTDIIVEVNLCSDSGVTCQGLPASANLSEYIRVRITSTVYTTFARVVGRSKVQNVVEAIARAQGSTTTSSFFSGAGMAATRNDNSDQCFLINGNANLTLHGTGIFVNCTGNEALFINGGANVGLGADANVVGADATHCAKNQGGNLSGRRNDRLWPTPQTVDAETFANVPTAPSPTPTCSSPGTYNSTNNTLTPGYYNGNVSMNSTTTMIEGTYCFNGGLNLNGQANLQESGTGLVQIILGNGSLNMNGSNNTFDNVEILYDQRKLQSFQLF